MSLSHMTKHWYSAHGIKLEKVLLVWLLKIALFIYNSSTIESVYDYII